MRRQSTEQQSCLTRIANAQYLLIALCFLSLQYYTFVLQFMRDRYESKPTSTLGILFIYHVIIFMLLWSMYQTITSDPGKVPLYWGVIMDDPETKKRRYCLICHQFKPERSHHCSNCQRCVLNMDHHCPWIINCIGFTNRKFFILMVFYITIAALYMLTFEVIFILNYIHRKEDSLYQLSILNLIYKGLAIIVTFGFFLVIANFFQFHLKLLFKNTTTIEMMEKARLDLAAQQPPTPPAQYDFGWKLNWYQVFGMNSYLWLLPIFGQSGKPLGDGVIWDKNQLIGQIDSQGRRYGYSEVRGAIDLQQNTNQMMLPQIQSPQRQVQRNQNDPLQQQHHFYQQQQQQQQQQILNQQNQQVSQQQQFSSFRQM